MNDIFQWLAAAFGVLAAVLAIWLARVLMRQRQFRRELKWILAHQEVGCKALFSTERSEVLSGLQLLAVFGGGRLSPSVLTRVGELSTSADSELAQLAKRVLNENW